MTMTFLKSWDSFENKKIEALAIIRKCIDCENIV
tara:strand:+ start:493 stop:594 length:102 start_codon:yes stop_codon:yes gene_type:complete